MSKQLRALLERKEKAVKAAKDLNEKASLEKRDLTAEETQQLDAHLAEVGKLNASIERQRQLDAAEASLAGVEIADDAQVTVDAPNVMKDPKRGFKHFGEFARDVHSAAIGKGASDKLRAAAPSTYGSEGVGADGGYTVPPEFANEVFTHSLEGDPLLPMTDENPVSGNSMTFPKDETTPWGTDGIRAYWEGEASAATATKPKLGITQMRLHKLFALVPITDELGDDSPALASYLTRKMGDSIRWKSDDALVNGSGAGMPLGYMASGSLVTVTKESGQAVDTVVVENVVKMFARMPADSLRNARWMVNNDVLPQLLTLKIGDTPVFTPPGAIANAPNGLLLGRPIVITQHCKTIGDKGDIAFVDWKKYRTLSKRSGIAVASSIHLYFDAGATAFRATFRLDGQPAIASPIVPARGSNNLSPFVVIEDR